ncbi:MAG: rRNA maturation RNase YbeY [Candidatus Omnitrophica bacterium]|nr:rRNA maturation RNase YbeY [Candidatus Omnitrophota bacterium]MBU0879064.1 rRNA maturation RNase YbeY [Candidatus Omnitrophota bacterium]MBU1133884.1 rRNA maturation RNase YbeY [Candidatus Omnitrophota bacterium]MBU1810667.1 rRNA maturation RNase YbeY [Candidatus Omnitrophota bacterium]
MIEIINQQKIKRINLKELREYLKRILIFLDIPSKKISILLCDNKFIRGLNKKFFRKDSSTDVISFPLKDDFDPDYLGEVAISVEEAAKAAKQYANTWQEELVLYLVHGVLHLLDYTDRTKKHKEAMDKKQKEIMEKFVVHSS